MNGGGPTDFDLARAAWLHLEAERAFGISSLGARWPVALEIARLSAPPTMLEAMPRRDLEAIAREIEACRACGLCETRRHAVPGQGAARARLLFIGEAPGEDEDRQGLAFVGRSGQLLTKMIAALGLAREDVFIANILKCRPPENRPPTAAEVNSCFHFLLDQIDRIEPEVICTLGATATNNLLDRTDPMHRLRGRVFDFRGRKLVPTFHPSHLLRHPEEKKKAWEDLQVVARLLGIDVSAVKARRS